MYLTYFKQSFLVIFEVKNEYKILISRESFLNPTSNLTVQQLFNNKNKYF